MTCRRFSGVFFLVRFFPTHSWENWGKPPGNGRNGDGGMACRAWTPGMPATRPTNPVESRRRQGPEKRPPPQGSRGADQVDTRGRFSAGARRGLDCALVPGPPRGLHGQHAMDPRCQAQPLLAAAPGQRLAGHPDRLDGGPGRAAASGGGDHSLDGLAATICVEHTISDCYTLSPLSTGQLVYSADGKQLKMRLQIPGARSDVRQAQQVATQHHDNTKTTNYRIRALGNDRRSFPP